jgi:hypothetical protein
VAFKDVEEQKRNKHEEEEEGVVRSTIFIIA